MKKNLKYFGTTLLFVVSALPSAHAQSSVTLYGVVDDGLAYTSNQGGHSNVYMTGGTLNADKFGLTGAEDLGGGTRTIFTLEEGFNINTGAQSASGLAFNRQAFVGMKNDDYGTATAGRQYTPYFKIVGTYAPAAIVTGAGAHPGDVDGLDTTVRGNNSIVYYSPNLSGFQFGAMYGFGGTAGSLASGNTISAAMKYDHGPFSAAVGYLRLNNSDGAGATFSSNASGSFAISAINSGYVSAKTIQMVAAALQYSSNALRIGANYSNVQFRPVSSSLFTQTATFNIGGVYASYYVRPDIYIAGAYSYTAARSANGISDRARYNQISFEETYNLSKRTALYAVQSYQHATGKTLNSSGVPINAVASVGDSQNGTPSSSGSQFVTIIGIRSFF